MILFKVYLDNENIKNMVNEYVNNWDSLLFVETDYLLMNTHPISVEDWKQWDNWLTANDIDYDYWKVI